MVQETPNCKQSNLWPYGSLVNLQTPDVICGLHFYLHILESDSASSPWFMPVPFPPWCHQANGTSLIFLSLPSGKTWLFGVFTGFWGRKKPNQNQNPKPPNKNQNTTNQKKNFCSAFVQKENLKIIEISHFKLFWVQCILQVPDSQIWLGLYYISLVLAGKKLSGIKNTVYFSSKIF